MSEDRHVNAEADDDEARPEDEATAAPPPVEAKVEKAPRDRPSQRKSSGETPSARRVRARMTLRIPDDEVGRPTPLAMPVADPVEPAEPGPEIKGTRIISVGPPPPDESALDDATTPAPPVVVRADREDSWTPYQPTVNETVNDNGPPTPREAYDPDKTGEYGSPVSEEIPISDGLDVNESGERLDIDDSDTTSTPPPPPPSPPPHKRSGPPPKSGSVPPPPPLPSDLPPLRAPMRAIIQSDDGEDVRFDDDEPVIPLSEPKPRASEPGEAPEISVDDLVSVESLPKARPAPPAGIPPMRPKVKSIPPPPPSQPPPPHVVVAPSPPAPATAPNSQSSPPAQQVNGGTPSSQPAKAPTPPTPSRVIVPQPAAPQGLLAPPAMTEAAAQRKRTRPWWEELFNDDFIRASAKVTDAQIGGEVTFIEESLGIAQDGVLLDLACGTGLHAIELTRRGYHVVGFDLSLAMLARAADEAHDRSAKLNFVQGDMRDMTFEEQFDGVYCWGTSFGYFEEDKNAQVISRVHRSLKPGGVFLLDVVNRDYIMKQSPSLAWFEGEGCICMDEMQLDWITSRMRVKRTMMLDDGRTKEIEYSIRVYALHELGRILHEQGFRVAEVSGRTATPGIFFGSDSPRTLILAEKR